MSVQNALEGLGMLNGALDKNKARQFEKELMDIKQKYQTSERQGEEKFKSGESAKDRANRIKLEQIQQGPEYAKINMEKQRIAREQGGRDAAAQALSSDIAGQTPTGKMVQPLLKSGAISPQAALAAMPERSSLEWITQLNGMAMSADTPEKATAARSLADTAMKFYSDVKEQEAYRKRIAEIKSKGDTMMDYNYNPAPVMTAARNLLNEKFKDYDQNKPLSQYFQKKMQKDPAFSRESVREELNAKLAAEIVKTDPKLGGDYLRAYQASSAIWEGWETGGVGNLLNTEKLDEEGNMVGTAKGWRPIPIRIDKNLYFQQGGQSGGQTSFAPNNSTQQPIFAAPTSQAAQPKPLATDHLADSYISGNQITNPVASAVK